MTFLIGSTIHVLEGFARTKKHNLESILALPTQKERLPTVAFLLWGPPNNNVCNRLRPYLHSFATFQHKTTVGGDFVQRQGCCSLGGVLNVQYCRAGRTNVYSSEV